MLNALGVAFLAFIGKLPLKTRRRLGRQLGDWARITAHRRRRIALRNIQLVFPQMAEEEHQAILHAHFHRLGESFLDECWGLSASVEKIKRFVKVENEDILHRHKQKILFAPHFLGLNLAGLRLSLCLPKPPLYYYRPMHSRFWDFFFAKMRNRFGSGGVSSMDKTGLRVGLRHLKTGGDFYYLPDIDAGRRKSAVFVQFLGVEKAATTTALSRFAAVGDAAVVPCIMTMTIKGYHLRIGEPLENFPGDGKTDAERMNRLIAKYVKQSPDQYFWLHRRFKTRPEGEDDLYGQ